MFPSPPPSPNNILSRLFFFFLYRNHQRWRNCIGILPTRTSSSVQKPDYCRSSGIQCWHWGPIILWDLGPICVSGNPPGLVGPPGWRGGRYTPMRGVRLLSTTLQLITFIPWKRFFSMCQPLGQFQTIIPTPSWVYLYAVVWASKYTTLYPILCRQYALSGILVSFRTIGSKPSIHATRTASTIPDPRPSRMW